MQRQSNLNLLLATVAVLLFACTQKSADTNSVKPNAAPKTTKDTTAQKSKITPKKDSIPPKPILNFFDFDAVDHYVIDYDGWESNQEKKSKFQTVLLKRANYDSTKFKFLDSLINQILAGECPKNTKDFAFVNYLVQMGFTKKTIPSNKLNTLNQIFAKRPCPNDMYILDCLPVYRDVYVLKKNARIIGTANICFSCDKFVFTGSKMKTNCFGYHGEYEQLEKLL